MHESPCLFDINYYQQIRFHEDLYRFYLLLLFGLSNIDKISEN